MPLSYHQSSLSNVPLLLFLGSSLSCEIIENQAIALEAVLEKTLAKVKKVKSKDDKIVPAAYRWSPISNFARTSQPKEGLEDMPELTRMRAAASLSTVGLSDISISSQSSIWDHHLASSTPIAKLPNVLPVSNEPLVPAPSRPPSTASSSSKARNGRDLHNLSFDSALGSSAVEGSPRTDQDTDSTSTQKLVNKRKKQVDTLRVQLPFFESDRNVATSMHNKSNDQPQPDEKVPEDEKSPKRVKVEEDEVIDLTVCDSPVGELPPVGGSQQPNVLMVKELVKDDVKPFILLKSDDQTPFIVIVKDLNYLLRNTPP